MNTTIEITSKSINSLAVSVRLTLSRWKTHLTLAADVVTDEITRAQEKLNERIDQ